MRAADRAGCLLCYWKRWVRAAPSLRSVQGVARTAGGEGPQVGVGLTVHRQTLADGLARNAGKGGAQRLVSSVRQRPVLGEHPVLDAQCCQQTAGAITLGFLWGSGDRIRCAVSCGNIYSPPHRNPGARVFASAVHGGAFTPAD
jgi:hypothetical protein